MSSTLEVQFFEFRSHFLRCWIPASILDVDPEQGHLGESACGSEKNAVVLFSCARGIQVWWHRVGCETWYCLETSWPMASTPTADAYTRPGATCWNSCLKPHDNGCKWWNMGLQVSAVHKMLANVELELQAERLGLDANVLGNASWRLSRLTIVSNILTFATTRSADSNLVHRTNDHMRALEKRRFFQEIGRNKTDISLSPRCLLFAPPWFH